jgi:CBS domain-containing protein
MQPNRSAYGGPSFVDAKVHDVMRVGTVTCRPGTSLKDVARIMVGYQIHSVLVEGDDPGEWRIITDLEVADAVASGGSDLIAADLAVPDLATVPADESLAGAAKLMAERRCTHLLAVQPSTGQPVGVISALGLAAVIAAEPS